MKHALLKLVAAGGLAFLAASCTTMYDSYGRPQQVVTPEGAALGAVAAGVLGYALNDNDDHGHRRHYRHHGNRNRYHSGGYYYR